MKQLKRTLSLQSENRSHNPYNNDDCNFEQSVKIRSYMSTIRTGFFSEISDYWFLLFCYLALRQGSFILTKCKRNRRGLDRALSSLVFYHRMFLSKGRSVGI